MDKTVALDVFKQLEAQRASDDDPTNEVKPPTFDVRLDAGSHDGRRELGGSSYARSWRIRVAESKAWGADTDDWRFVIELAEEHGLTIALQNNAMELT